MGERPEERNVLPSSVYSLPLANGGIALIDEADAEAVAGFSWRATRRLHTFYAKAYLGGGREAYVEDYLHRVILCAPIGMSVDHINGNGLDCRRSNLRLVTKSQNLMNQKHIKSSTSSYKGVRKTQNGSWTARIVVNRKEFHLGRFVSEQEAALAYNAAAIKHFGQYAALNVI